MEAKCNVQTEGVVLDTIGWNGNTLDGTSNNFNNVLKQCCLWKFVDQLVATLFLE
jgi:hypothetical protein